MGTNYTPLNTGELDKKYHGTPKKGNFVETVLLLIGTLTAIVLAFMLFILIQKKMQTAQEAPPATQTVPTRRPTQPPTPEPTEVVASPSAVPSVPQASPSATVSPSATASATPAVPGSTSPTPAAGSPSPSPATP